MSPVNEFARRFIFTRVADNIPKELGIVLSNKFLYKNNSFSEPNVPRNGGNGPVSRLAFAAIYRKEGH
jgi:hypothetical protein